MPLGQKGQGDAVSLVEKYFSRCLRARPLRTSSILPLSSFCPLQPAFSPVLALFPTLFHQRKIIVVFVVRSAPEIVLVCVRTCANDARTMALNWRLTGEQ